MDEDEDDEEEDDDDDEEVDASALDAVVDESSGFESGRRVRLPCFELLCTNILSDMANKCESTTLSCVAMTT